MNAHADKAQENKSQAVANSIPKLQSNGKSSVQFVDNRSKSIAQRKLQEMANNSLQAYQLRAFQDMANNNHQVKESTTIQMRIRENGELYEKEIAPRGAWGFSAQEITIYNIINDADHPEITFSSTQEMKTFINRVAPFLSFFRTELSQLNSPIASDQVIEALAQRSEINRQGHGLARHGPQIRMPHLRDRLTTGFVGGAFAPAGAQGFATTFISHDAFLISQKTAIQHIQNAYRATANGLQPLITALRNRIQELNGLSGREIGNKKREIMTANRTIVRFIDANNLNNPNTADITMMPVKINRDVYNSVGGLNHDQYNQVDNLLEFFERYKIVLTNAEQIGRGLRVKEEEREHPKGTVVNPAYPLSGVSEPIFEAQQLQSMGNISNTSTTVNPPNIQFVFNANVTNWTVPQHFPDNGAVGWRA